MLARFLNKEQMAEKLATLSNACEKALSGRAFILPAGFLDNLEAEDLEELGWDLGRNNLFGRCIAKDKDSVIGYLYVNGLLPHYSPYELIKLAIDYTATNILKFMAINVTSIILNPIEEPDGRHTSPVLIYAINSANGNRATAESTTLVLLENAAELDINVKDVYNNSALYSAMYYGLYGVTSEILKRNPSCLKEVDNDGQTFLTEALSKYKSHWDSKRKAEHVALIKELMTDKALVQMSLTRDSCYFKSDIYLARSTANSEIITAIEGTFTELSIALPPIIPESSRIMCQFIPACVGACKQTMASTHMSVDAMNGDREGITDISISAAILQADTLLSISQGRVARA